MVCNRCKMAVATELQDAKIQAETIELGEVTLKQVPEQGQLSQLRTRLQSLGFELIDDQKSKVIERIKTLIIEQVHYSADLPRFKLSVWLAEQLKYDYHYLSNLFSAVEGQTIEKYHIAQKVERVKELMVYNELTLSEIAFQTGYSSVAHLSSQFKQVTGLTPTAFIALQGHQRNGLDQL
jgi:AraC-like DNA-binding protein